MNLESAEKYERSINKYINEHPNSMYVLLEKNAKDEFEVFYANKIAKAFFLSDESMHANVFFGNTWKKLKRSIRNIHTQTYFTSTINLIIDEKHVLFEIVCQRDADSPEIVCIELRKRMDLTYERNLRSELKYKYKSVIDHNLDPIISVDQNLKMIHANPAVNTVFNYRTKELSGRSFVDLIEEEDVDRVKIFFLRVFLGQSIELEEISFSHKNGKYSTIYIKAIPVIVKDEVTEVHLMIRDTTLHQEHNEKLLFLSYHDQLTGLWNRRLMKEHFNEDTHNSFGSNKNMSVIHVGLDRFKLFNESIGYTGADEILKKVADRLKSSFPKFARLYRNGGDEFVILLQNHSLDNTEKLAQQILTEFGKPFYYNRQEYFVSASIGISVYPKDGTTLEELIGKSKQALTFVKERGRFHYRFYKEDMNSNVPDEALMESYLRKAIEHNELTVYYQPQVDLRTGHIDSFEALLRWNNKEFGFVSPATFIPIAEESGLIHGIGDWVLNQVCKQLKEWQEKGFRPVRIAINISPNQFRTEIFANKVENKIEEYGIIPSSLEVEITESSLANMSETLITLNKLKEIGVFISVDDFGTGYSSLSYLRQYPIDIIKIDRSFVQDIETDEKNKAIAKTIINLAHNLGMEVIAEGVEKDLQATILLEANCHKAQGFLYSRAVPVDEIMRKYFSYS